MASLEVWTGEKFATGDYCCISHLNGMLIHCNIAEHRHAPLGVVVKPVTPGRVIIDQSGHAKNAE